MEKNFVEGAPIPKGRGESNEEKTQLGSGSIIHVKDRPERAIFNTAVPTKRRYFDQFAQLISNQFEHGGDKYALDWQPDKEFTDLVCEVAPGKTGIDWILQTIVKYCGRYLNFQREKDLLKIATYCYIAWLKKGCHLREQHDEDAEENSS